MRIAAMNPAKIADTKYIITRTDVPTAGGGLKSE